MILMSSFKSHKVSLLVLLIAFFVGSGCSNRIADLTLVSTKNIDLSNASLDLKHGKRTKGEDCKFVFIVPFGMPSLEEAIDDALEKGRGNIMVDQVSYAVNKSFIVGQMCIEVEGTVLRTAEKRTSRRQNRHRRR